MDMLVDHLSKVIKRLLGENDQLRARIVELESALAYEEKIMSDHRRDEAREDPKQQRLIPVKEGDQ